jgi:hypothetical protein
MGLISNGTTVFDAGSMAAGFGGSMTFIKKLTASNNSTLSFVDGASGVVLDNTYKEYVFIFNNVHASAGGVNVYLQFQGSINGGSGYGVNITSTYFDAIHGEDGSGGALSYQTSFDLAQSDDFQSIATLLGGDADNGTCGTLHLFNPSSTTFVKHFTCTMNHPAASDESKNSFIDGYFNTTSAINAIQFKLSTNNLQLGDICLYGIA